MGGKLGTCDDDLLHLACAFVNPKRPDLAVKLLDLDAAQHTGAAENLDRLVDDALRRFGRDELCERCLLGDALGCRQPSRRARLA